jgi:hypothetical protein
MTPPSSPRAGEPRTEAGRRLWDSAHGLTRLDKAVTRDKARDLIREEVLRIEAEARAGEAALDRLRLELNVYDAMPVHEYTEETIRSAEGRIIIAAREVARRAGEAEGGARLDVDRLARAMMEALTPGYREGPGSKAYKTMHRRRAEAIAAEYAALASPEPPREAEGGVRPLNEERLVRALKALHGDNVPLYARHVRTTPEDYAAKILEMDRLASPEPDEEAR